MKSTSNAPGPENERAVFLVIEIWLKPGQTEALKTFKRSLNASLAPFEPEYLIHQHAFEWVMNSEAEPLPSGLEIIKFSNEAMARKAIACLRWTETESSQSDIFERIRCYLSAYEIGDGFLPS